MLISILIPVYNEKNTIEQLLQKVHSAPYPNGYDYEIICVDDCSTDGSTAWLKEYTHPKVKKIFKEKNEGKGSAISAALKEASGDIMIIQDADLEYDPNEYPQLLNPIIGGHADVVYGSRFLVAKAQRVHFYWHALANKFLTHLSNMLTNVALTDMETCYKAFTKEAISGIKIKSKKFGIEPEITAKFAKKKCRIYEVPISYYGRSYQEGKKINWRDGLKAIVSILKYNLFI